MSEDFEKIFNEQFSFVKLIKQKENSRIVVMRHNLLDKKVVRIDTDKNYQIYNTLKQITHPNLPEIIGIFHNSNGFSVIEEYIDGLTVSEVIEGGLYHKSGAIAVCKAVCSALDTLHQNNIIHRDVKPENVMIDKKGNVKLIDFDAARIHKNYQPQDTTIMGTTGFAAPEQFGMNQSDARTDIYAVGVLLNVMLTGEHPSKTIYPGRIGKIISKCCSINPNERYSSAASLFNAL